MVQIITKYYRLFEIRLLHEYFLIGEDRLDFYSRSASEREAILQQRVQLGNYKIMDDLVIRPTRQTAQLLKNYRLKFKPTLVGIIVGGEGKLTESGTIQPFIPLDGDLELNFKIEVSNPLFKNYTLLPLKNNVVGNFLFSNNGQLEQSTSFKSLSQAVPEFQPGNNYVAGELTNLAGILNEAVADTDSINHWSPISGIGYVNENDRRNYPKMFSHIPTKGEGIYDFELTNINDKRIHKIQQEVTSSQPIKLDFSRTPIEKSNSQIQMIPLPDGIYKLKISTPLDNSEKTIFLSDEFKSSDLGMINIRLSVEDQAYGIINSDGELPTNPHSTFEIRFRSRKTFWRYQARNRSKKLRPMTDIDASFFDDENNQPATSGQSTKYLITKIPQKMARLPINIIEPMGSKEYFPQPRPSPFRQKYPNEAFPNNEPPGKIYSDIYITSINGKIDVV